MRRRIAGPAAAAVVAVGGLLVSTSPAQAASPGAAAQAASPAAAPVVVVTKLNNPRQLAWADKGHRQLLIAEAGHGGTDGCFSGMEGETCLGLTGSISLVTDVALRRNSLPYRVVKNLPSAAGPDGSAATGPDGVTARGLNAIFIAETWAPPKDLPAKPAYQNLDGKLILASRTGPVSYANIAKVELTQNPDGTDVNPNPYATLALPDGRVLVADAGGNDILAVKGGKVSVLTVLPRHGCGGHFTGTLTAMPCPRPWQWGRTATSTSANSRTSSRAWHGSGSSHRPAGSSAGAAASPQSPVSPSACMTRCSSANCLVTAAPAGHQGC